jgi:hypothetical protein
MLTLLACSAVWAASAPPNAPAEPARELAVWVPVQLKFVYRPLTTTYSCSGLEARIKGLLLKLGARPDLDVRGYGCTKLSGPDPLAGVKIRMNVLEAKGPNSWVEARWKRVDLLDDRTLLDAAADCDLVRQFEQEILPVFATRNVDYAATCEARNAVPGSTRLKADVLVANQRAAPPSAGR